MSGSKPCLTRSQQLITSYNPTSQQRLKSIQMRKSRLGSLFFGSDRDLRHCSLTGLNLWLRVLSLTSPPRPHSSVVLGRIVACPEMFVHLGRLSLVASVFWASSPLGQCPLHVPFHAADCGNRSPGSFASDNIFSGNFLPLGLDFLFLAGLSALDVSLCLPGLASCQSSKANKPRNTQYR
ncbi:hypothetical protein FKP32DRAFT_62654 [Trametes sanguinea]|nr:hypothetical protein FKP32DRAFT_62654 [Trametes sanguinea]